MSSQSVKSITRDIGPDNLAKALGVGKHSIRNAIWSGKFPANWFDVVSELCRRSDIDCPRDLFSFKTLPADYASQPTGASA